MIATCVAMALAAGGIAATMSRSKLFLWLREWPTAHMHDRALRGPTDWEYDTHGWEVIATLVRCPYCIAHWLVFAMTAIYRPRLVHSGASPVDVLVTMFAVVTVACAVAGLLCVLYWKRES